MLTYMDSHIRPGSLVTVSRDGVTRTERIKSVYYTSGKPAIHASLNWWQRAIRAVTPQRWRKPIPVIREAELPQMMLVYEGSEADAVRRHLDMLTAVNAQIQDSLGR